MKVYESAISTGDKSKNDRLIIYHCTNSNKLRGKAKCFGGDALMANMEDLVHELQLRNEHEVQCVVEEQGPDMIAHQIKAYADAHADVLVVGQFKDVDIEKPDDDHEQGHLVAKGCKAALIVVKGSSKLALLNKRRFLAIVDGSDISHTAMLKAVQFMRKGDYIKVVYLETRFSAAPGKSLVKKCESWLAENKVLGRVQVGIANALGPANAIGPAKGMGIDNGIGPARAPSRATTIGTTRATGTTAVMAQPGLVRELAPGVGPGLGSRLRPGLAPVYRKQLQLSACVCQSVREATGS